MRELGESGISYGTAQAFEGEQGKFVLENKTDVLLINLRTLIRNAREAFPSESSAKDSIESIAEATLEDIKGVVKQLTQIATINPIEIKLYYPSYQSLKSIFKKATLWEPSTEKQIALNKLLTSVAQLLIKKHPELIETTDSHLLDFKGRGTIITHHPVDLVLTPSWNRLTLLESYSGAVKPYILWYSKLTGQNLENIPLTKLTIQVFGDQSVNFRSSSNGIKNLVKDLAVKARWTSATTPDRVKASINTFLSGVDKEGLKLLL